MDVNVFVGSTYRDMAVGYRPAVLQAIETAGDVLKPEGAHACAVHMEKWDVDWEPVLQVCLAKIGQDSTHYLGVLGYLRGFVPPEERGTATSITEAELNYAHSCGLHMAVFVPKDGSEAAKELKRRAVKIGQSDAELAAQMDFIDRVTRDRAAQQFDTLPCLALWVMRKVVSWGKGGLRAMPRG